MRISRRDFLKYCAMSAGALGLSTTDMIKLEKALASEPAQGGTRVVWLNGAACTGCTVSFANTKYFSSVQDLLVPWSVAAGLPGLTDLDDGKLDGALDIDFIETLSSSVGARAVNAAFGVLGGTDNFVLCLEGAIQTDAPTTTSNEGDYCQIWRTDKRHSLLNPDTFVYASADRDALGVSNDSSEVVVLVNSRAASAPIASTAGKIMLPAGSVITTADTLHVGSWIEKDVDSIAMGLTVDGNNKTTASVPPVTPRTLAGRVELTALSITSGSLYLASNSIVRALSDRTAIGGTYTYAPKTPSGVTKTVHNNITLAGTVMLAAGSILMPGTVIAMGSWGEDSADRSLPVPGSWDGDHKLQFGAATLTTAQTLTGRLELLAGSVLQALSITTDLGYSDAGEDRTFMDEVLNFAIASNCVAVLAVGTCASFGGIPAANGNETGARGLVTAKSSGGYAKVNNQGYWDWLKDGGKISTSEWESLMRKTICVSGCPPHPDWIVGTLVYFLNSGQVPPLDKYHRPTDFYGSYQCSNCIWKLNDASNTKTEKDIDNLPQTSKSGRATGDSPKLYLNKYASSYEGCIGILGCKGRKTKADCSYRRWNTNTTGSGGVSWCVQTRAGCHGCTEPRYPDGWGKFFAYK